MPKIPGARERLNTQVPRRRARSTGQPLTEAMSNLGGTVANIGNTIAAKRKEMQDQADFQEKRMQLEKTFQDFDQQLQRDVRPDGTLPESYGTNEEGPRNKTYDQAVQEFFNDEIPRYNEAMVSDEARSKFSQYASAVEQENVIKADSFVFKLQTQHSIDQVKESYKQDRKMLINQEALSLDQASRRYRSLLGTINVKRQKGVLTERQSDELAKVVTSGYATTVMNKLIKEERWPEAIQFLDAGVSIKGFVNEEGQKATSAFNKKQREELRGDLKDGKTLFSEENKLVKSKPVMKALASNLTSEQFKQYRNKIISEIGKKRLLNEQSLSREINAFSENAMLGRIDLDDPDQIDSFKNILKTINSKDFIGDKAGRARKMFEISVAAKLNQITGGDSFAAMSKKKRSDYVKNLKLESIEKILHPLEEKYPGLQQEFDAIKNQTPQTLKAMKSVAVSKAEKFNDKINSLYEEDFAGTAITFDAELRELLKKEPRKYLDRAKLLAEKQDIGSPNLVPERELEDFSKIMSVKASESSAAGSKSPDKALELIKKARQWGPSAWQEVKYEYANKTDIAPEIKVASFIIQDGSERSSNLVGTVLNLDSDKRQNEFESLSNAGLNTKGDITYELNEDSKFSDMKQALTNTATAAQADNSLRNSLLEIVAADVARQMNGSSSTTMEDAIDQSVGTYITRPNHVLSNENSSIWIPKSEIKGEPKNIQKFLDKYSSGSGIETFKNIFPRSKEVMNRLQGGFPVYDKDNPEMSIAGSKETFDESYYGLLKNKGKWVTTPDGKGVIYMVRGKETVEFPVPKKDGSFIFTWDELYEMGKE